MGRTTKQYKEIEKVKETIQKYIDGANGDLKVLKEAYNAVSYTHLRAHET